MKSNTALNYLLVYEHMRTGGIETLIVRMANWLIGEGHHVDLILVEPGELTEMLDSRVQVHVLGKKGYCRLLLTQSHPMVRQLDDKDIDVMYSYGPGACYLAACVYKVGFKDIKPKFLNGIYHPNEFSLCGKPCSLDRMYVDMYNHYVDNRSKLFMSEQVREGNEPILGMTVPESQIWPLPIDGSQFEHVDRRRVPYRIVSVGRFADFKTYNLYMFDVIEALRDKGYDATWEVYGYGPLGPQMKQQLEERRLEHCVTIREKVSYEAYARALSVAHVFVGVGTALIEAGYCKIPCVPAIKDDTEAITYGALYDLPYYACGEILDDAYSTMPVINAISRLFDMTPDQYLAEGEQTYQYVQCYSIDKLMHQFVDIALYVPQEQNMTLYPKWKFQLHCILWGYEQVRRVLGVRTMIRRWAGHLQNGLQRFFFNIRRRGLAGSHADSTCQ
jgi:glycosyltransferase involved in cell wall biosynthesis